MLYTKNKVSIAIPAYKKTFLAEAIRSALKQSYDNIELIIVNDNSPYDLKSIVYSFNDPRVVYYENEVNLGKDNIVKNWNRCIDLARGEFFVLLCDDDIIYPDFVKELVILANKYSTCNVFHAPKQVIDNSNNIVREDDFWPEWESLESFYEEKKRYKRFHTITEFLYRTEYIKKIKYIAFPVAWGSDDISIINFIKEGGIASANQYLAAFRMNNEHISKDNTYIFEKAKARILNIYWLAEFFSHNKHDADYMHFLDILMVEFIKRANILDKIRILFIVPFQSWNFIKKLKILIGIFVGKYKHPGYGAIGV